MALMFTMPSSQWGAHTIKSNTQDSLRWLSRLRLTAIRLWGVRRRCTMGIRSRRCPTIRWLCRSERVGVSATYKFKPRSGWMFPLPPSNPLKSIETARMIVFHRTIRHQRRCKSQWMNLVMIFSWFKRMVIKSSWWNKIWNSFRKR